VDAPVPLIAAALLAAFAVLRPPTPPAPARAAATVAALALTAAILVARVSGTSQWHSLSDHPALIAAAAVLAAAAVVMLAVLFHRRPAALALAAVGALPFRVPIALGGATANLLLPLYLVVAAGALAYAVPRLRGREDGPSPPRPAGLEWALMGLVALYAVQASYSGDFEHALEQVVFFYIPFSVLFVLLARLRWTPRLALGCLAVLVGLALAFVGVGFVEYSTRRLLLNPKVIASNQFETYFRVNSLFFDPNIYGRFLALVMLAVTGVLLWTTRTRTAVAAAVVLATLWAGLLLTFSQSSFGALLVGLAVLGGLRWSPRAAWSLATVGVVASIVLVLVAPGALRLDLGSSKSADAATSGRFELIKGGVRLFGDRPVFGWGAGSFPREFRRHEQASSQKATSASHTIPVTVAAEQGVVGLALYVALLALALARLFRGVRGSPVRAVVAAAFAALLFHTMLYAAFLEDPLTWALLGVGTALAAAPRQQRPARLR
jgi:O-antigen ligase